MDGTVCGRGDDFGIDSSRSERAFGWRLSTFFSYQLIPPSMLLFSKGREDGSGGDIEINTHSEL
jgi:hypothetical protein